MALSGSVNTTSYEGRYYTLSWTATQSVTDNTSTITWTLSTTGGVSWYAERTLNVVIAGSTVFSKTARVERYAGTIATGTKTITHDTSGNASFGVSIQAAVYGSTVNCTGSATFQLNNIPRRSTLYLTTGTLGTPQTLTVTRNSNSFTHSIKFTCGSETGYIKADGSVSSSEVKHSGTSISFTPPYSWANNAPASTKAYVQFTLMTYNGSTSLGAYVYSCGFNIPSSIIPSCDINVSDATGYADEYGGYIQGVSKLSVTITPTPAYSPITSYTTVLNGTAYTTASFTTGVLSYSGTKTITSIVTDKRGRSGSATKSITVIPYSKPAITLLKVRRCVSETDGTEDPQGEYVQVTFSGNVDPIDPEGSGCGANSSSWSIEYKKTSETEWKYLIEDGWSDWFGMNEQTDIFAADSGSSYDVRVTVKDAFNTASWSTVVSTAATIMHFPASGEGMGIGKVVENEGHFELNYPAQFYKNAHFKEQLTYDIPICDSGYDCNNMMTSGMYYMGVSATNKPGSGLNGWLEVQNAGSDYYCYQRYVTFTGEKYERFKYEGVWKAWEPYGTFHNPLYLHNSTSINMKNTSGAYRNVMYVNESNALCIGYESYLNSEGYTWLFGNGFNIISKNNVVINGMTFGTNKVLWSGASHMNGSQTASLSEAISAQVTGIILIFSYYSGTTTGDHDFSSHFVPKQLVAAHGGMGSGFTYFPPGHDSGFTSTKYLYISDTAIKGYAMNTSDAGKGSNGITYYNSHRVLRYVIGV